MTLPTQLRGLADLVERVEDNADVDVRDATIRDVDEESDRIEADLVVATDLQKSGADVGIKHRLEGACPVEQQGPTDADGDATHGSDVSDPQEDDGDGADDEEDEVDRAPKETPGSEEVVAGEKESTFACDVDGCDYAGDTERALKIHQSRTHDTSRVLEEKIAALLEEEGELPARDIKSEIEASGDVWNRLSSMQDEGVVEARKDPDDGRRKLYSLVDVRGDGGARALQNGASGVDLPGELTPAEVTAAADDCTTLGEVADRLDISAGKARTALFRLGVYKKVRDVVGYRGEGGGQ